MSVFGRPAVETESGRRSRVFTKHQKVAPERSTSEGTGAGLLRRVASRKQIKFVSRLTGGKDGLAIAKIVAVREVDTSERDPATRKRGRCRGRWSQRKRWAEAVGIYAFRLLPGEVDGP